MTLRSRPDTVPGTLIGHSDRSHPFVAAYIPDRHTHHIDAGALRR